MNRAARRAAKHDHPTPSRLSQAQAEALATQVSMAKQAEDTIKSISPGTGHGGKRRRHMPPSLTAETLPIVSAMHRQGDSHRTIAKAVHVSAETVRRAINHVGAYQGSGI